MRLQEIESAFSLWNAVSPCGDKALAEVDIFLVCCGSIFEQSGAQKAKIKKLRLQCFACFGWVLYCFGVLQLVLQHAFDSFSSHPLACAQPRYSRTLAELNVIIVESLIGLSYPFVEFFRSTSGRAHVKLLTEGLPGIHQRFIPKKRFVCSRESTKRFLRFFPGNDAKRTLVSKLHIYHHCSENLMRF